MSIKTLVLKISIVSTLMVAGCGNSGQKPALSAAAKPANATITDEIVALSTNEGRNISTRVLTPDGCEACPLVIFSHGANAAYDRYDALIVPLAQAGYRVAVPNHTDSEDHPDRAAYTPADWLPNRLEDYNVIAARYETDYRIAAGHSFGALIAQIAGGAEMTSGASIDVTFMPDAVLAYSPPGPIPSYIEPEGWSQIEVPILVTTGTKDIVPMMAEEWELHLVSFVSAPPSQSFALVYENMDHYMNGAYGRETQVLSMERDRAVKHMVDASIFFVTKFRDDNKLSSADWKTLENDFVEARTRK